MAQLSAERNVKMHTPSVYSSLPSMYRTCLLLSVLLVGCDPAGSVDTGAPDPSADKVVAGTVQLLVDFSGERSEVNVKVPCSADSTVFQILQRAEKMGDLEFDSQGTGGTAFVHSIKGVMNKGSRGNNWVFRVNGQLGRESCGLLAVEPGDVIEWRYGQYEEPEDE